MKLEIVLKDSTDFDKSDMEFELESIETITNVRNLTQNNPTVYTAYVDSSYDGKVVAGNIRFMPRVDSVTVESE